MNTLDAMKQALEALEQSYIIPNSMLDLKQREKTITNLRTAITEMEQVDPVAWMQVEDGATRLTTTKGGNAGVWDPLYTHPQDRDSIIEECAKVCELGGGQSEYARYYLTQIRALKGK